MATSRGLFFDEDMSPLFEDVDLCLRAREQGLVVHIAGEMEAWWILNGCSVLIVCCIFFRGGSGYLYESAVYVR